MKLSTVLEISGKGRYNGAYNNSYIQCYKNYYGCILVRIFYLFKKNHFDLLKNEISKFRFRNIINFYRMSKQKYCVIKNDIMRMIFSITYLKKSQANDIL